MNLLAGVIFLRSTMKFGDIVAKRDGMSLSQDLLAQAFPLGVGAHQSHWRNIVD
jgi:hypothetical protein